LLGLYQTRRNVESLAVGNKSVSGEIGRSVRASVLPLGGLWLQGTLVSTIGLLQVGEQAIADRYVYLPLIGIFIALVSTVWDLATETNSPKTWRAVPAISILAVLWKTCVVSYWVRPPRESDANATILARAAVFVLFRSKLKYRATIVTVAEVRAAQDGGSIKVAGVIENQVALREHAISSIAEIV
jgi:hypothetical protein